MMRTLSDAVNNLEQTLASDVSVGSRAWSMRLEQALVDLTRAMPKSHTFLAETCDLQSRARNILDLSDLVEASRIQNSAGTLVTALRRDQ